MKFNGLHIAIALLAVFIAGLATGIVVKAAHGAELAIPRHGERLGRMKQAKPAEAIPLTVGKTPLPEEPRACTRQLKEMKLCL